MQLGCVSRRLVPAALRNRVSHSRTAPSRHPLRRTLTSSQSTASTSDERVAAVSLSKKTRLRSKDWVRWTDQEDSDPTTRVLPYVVAMAKSEVVESGRGEEAQNVPCRGPRMTVEMSPVYERGSLSLSCDWVSVGSW